MAGLWGLLWYTGMGGVLVVLRLKSLPSSGAALMRCRCVKNILVLAPALTAIISHSFAWEDVRKPTLAPGEARLCKSTTTHSGLKRVSGRARVSCSPEVVCLTLS
jgi:hypothetical protein